MFYHEIPMCAIFFPANSPVAHYKDPASGFDWPRQDIRLQDGRRVLFGHDDVILGFVQDGLLKQMENEYQLRAHLKQIDHSKCVYIGPDGKRIR